MKRAMKVTGIMLTAMVIMLFLNKQTLAQDQPDHRPPMFPDSVHVVKMVDQMAEALSLSKEQKATITKMNLAHFKEMKTILDEARGDHEKTREKIEAMYEKFEGEMASTLNDQQKGQLKEFLEKHRPPMKGRPECK